MITMKDIEQAFRDGFRAGLREAQSRIADEEESHNGEEEALCEHLEETAYDEET